MKTLSFFAAFTFAAAALPAQAQPIFPSVFRFKLLFTSRTAGITPSSGALRPGQYETIICGPKIIWPDSIAFGPDGYMYFTADQLNR